MGVSLRLTSTVDDLLSGKRCCFGHDYLVVCLVSILTRTRRSWRGSTSVTKVTAGHSALALTSPQSTSLHLLLFDRSPVMIDNKEHTLCL